MKRKISSSHRATAQLIATLEYIGVWDFLFADANFDLCVKFAHQRTELFDQVGSKRRRMRYGRGINSRQ